MGSPGVPPPSSIAYQEREKDPSGLFEKYQFIQVCKWLGIPPDRNAVTWDDYLLALSCMNAENEARAKAEAGRK